VPKRWQTSKVKLYEHFNTCSTSSADGMRLHSRAVRLDWFRFQALTSVARSAFKMQTHANFVMAMNTAIFHLKQIDDLDEMLRETSDLSIYWSIFQPIIYPSNSWCNFQLPSASLRRPPARLPRLPSPMPILHRICAHCLPLHQLFARTLPRGAPTHH
jgi:hypothetical protein